MPAGFRDRRGAGSFQGREVFVLSGSPFTSLSALETASSSKASELINSTTAVTIAHVAGDSVAANNGTYQWTGSTGVYVVGQWDKYRGQDATDILALRVDSI